MFREKKANTPDLTVAASCPLLEIQPLFLQLDPDDEEMQQSCC